MGIIFISQVDLANYMEREVNADKAAIALDSACDILRKEADQNFDYVADDTVVLDASGISDYLLLPEMPVYSVSGVTDVGASTTLVVDDEYYFDSEMGAITSVMGSPFLRGRKKYSVTYTHGYVIDASAPGLPANVQTYPSSLRMLALQLATRIYDQGLVQQETVGSYVAIYSARENIVLTDREKSMLERAVGIGRRR